MAWHRQKGNGKETSQESDLFDFIPRTITECSLVNNTHCELEFNLEYFI